MQHELIQQIYSAGVDPARFEDLLSGWAEKLVATHPPDGSASLEGPEIVAHIRQAVAIFDGLGGDARPPAGGSEDPWMDSLHPVMVCDGGGGIHRANGPASARYGAGHVTELPLDAAAIELILQAVAGASKRAAAGCAVIAARNTANGQPTVVSVQRHAAASSEARGAVRLISNELHWPDGLDPLLQSTFGLSAAECAVMRLMAEGASAAKVAELRGSSIPTVRAQVRSIYAKTGVCSQGELLRLAISFVSLSGAVAGAGVEADARPDMIPLHPRPDECRVLVLADGRRLAYADMGDPRGRPLVFLHDEYYGDGWSNEAVRCAAARGLRIIAPARPYFGSSDGYPPGADAAEQFAADLESLLDRLGIEHFVVLARRTGFRFAVEAAHRMPARVAGVLALSPALPAQSTSDYRHMTGLARFIAVAAFGNQALLELVCRAGIRYFRQMGPGRLARLLNRGSEEDLAVVEDPRYWPLIERGMTFSSANGYLAYLHDVRHDPVHAWNRAVTCPVHIRCLIGARDPHDREERAQRCVDAGADLNVATVEGAGQLFFLTHSIRVLNELREIPADIPAEV